MDKRVYFRKSSFPILFVFPQIVITVIFFIWPALQAFYQSFLIEDAFGLSTEFVWFENYQYVLSDPEYYETFFRTIVFSFCVSFLTFSMALLMAVAVNRLNYGVKTLCTILILPYAIAPAISGVLWMFMLDPSIGNLTAILKSFGVNWDYNTNGTQAMILVILAASARQISYNFVFFYAALQSVPKSLIEASAIDGAGPVKRFWTIVFPLISPTCFFLLVINIVYAFFESFGIIHTVTDGGPAKQTEILVFKVFKDGFIGLDLGSSAAQSILLLILVCLMTFVQFRFIEKKVKYA